MRKTILLLINGFGIEKKDSFEVFNKELMPTMDFMTKGYLFSSLVTDAGDYGNGYKDFSIPKADKKKEDQIDQLIFEKALDKNVVIKDLCTKLTKENKLHIFYNFTDDSKLHQVRELIKIINPAKDKQVFIHLILTSTSVEDYPDIVKAVGKLAFETGGLAKIGFIVGSDKINTDDTLRTFYKEFGEHWNESTKKFDILQKEIVSPKDAGIFHINKGFAISENDVLLFVNFTNVDCERFYTDIVKIPLHMFSLYPFKEEIPYAFSRESGAVTSISDLITKHNIKLLIFTENTRINNINYYINGMNKVLNPNITYAEFDLNLFNSKDNFISTIEKYDYDGMILDIDIGLYVDLAKIKQVLKVVDSIIKNISEASRENGYTFIISSCYGMHAQVNDGVVTRVINFSGKVPCIFQSNDFPKGEYSLSSGTTHDLALTFLTNICDDVKSNRIVKKLSGLDKALSKKR